VSGRGRHSSRESGGHGGLQKRKKGEDSLAWWVAVAESHGKQQRCVIATQGVDGLAQPAGKHKRGCVVSVAQQDVHSVRSFALLVLGERAVAGRGQRSHVHGRQPRAKAARLAEHDAGDVREYRHNHVRPRSRHSLAAVQALVSRVCCLSRCGHVLQGVASAALLVTFTTDRRSITKAPPKKCVCAGGCQSRQKQVACFLCVL